MLRITHIPSSVQIVWGLLGLIGVNAGNETNVFGIGDRMTWYGKRLSTALEKKFPAVGGKDHHDVKDWAEHGKKEGNQGCFQVCQYLDSVRMDYTLVQSGSM